MIADLLIQVVMDEVNMAMGRISSMPNQTERFSISRSFKQWDAISVQITGDELTERSMKALAVTIRDEILSLSSVTKADIQGARGYEISIELEETKLRQYGLTLDGVARAEVEHAHSGGAQFALLLLERDHRIGGKLAQAIVHGFPTRSAAKPLPAPYAEAAQTARS